MRYNSTEVICCTTAPQITTQQTTSEYNSYRTEINLYSSRGNRIELAWNLNAVR